MRLKEADCIAGKVPHQPSLKLAKYHVYKEFCHVAAEAPVNYLSHPFDPRRLVRLVNARANHCKQSGRRRFCALGQGMDDAAGIQQPTGGSPAQGRGRAVAEGHSRPPHRRSQAADLLRGYPEVLPRARRCVAAREGRDHRQEHRRARPGGRVRRRGRHHQEPRHVSRLSRAAGRSAHDFRSAGERSHCEGEAALSPVGRPAQRRGRDRQRC